MAAFILEEYANNVVGLAKVLERAKEKFGSAPSPKTVWQWRQKFADFGRAYKEAEHSQAVLAMDEANRESYQARIGKIETHDPVRGLTTKIADNVERSKLIVATLLKRAGVLNPALAERSNIDVNANVALAEKIAKARKRV